MSALEYSGEYWALYNVDCIEAMHVMPQGSIDCAVFSPPFGDLFVYSDSDRDLGNAGTGQAFFDQYRFFAESLAGVMKPGRIACVHCSDLPTRKGRDGYIGLDDFSGALVKAHKDAGMIYHGRTTIWKDPVTEMQRTKALGLLYKQIKKDSAMNRVGMPDYMLFFRKPGENPEPIQHCEPGSPEAVKIARRWLEYMHRQGLASAVPDDVMLAELIKCAEFDVEEWQRLASPVWMSIKQGNVLNGRKARCEQDEKHVCPLQLDVIHNCLRLYSKPGDVVFDPFTGIGSTGYQAVKMLRKFIGTELKPEYAKQAARFLTEAAATQSFDL